MQLLDWPEVGWWTTDCIAVQSAQHAAAGVLLSGLSASFKAGRFHHLVNCTSYTCKFAVQWLALCIRGSQGVP
jgi:hypothetical protein